MSFYPFIRPFVFALGAEAAHKATIAAVKFLPLHSAHLPESLKSTVAGVEFPSPVGLAAGFDKDAEIAAEMLTLGFGFVEVGTLTPRPQAGNPKPRLFRLTEDRAVINRMGFNNRGQADAFMRLEACSRAGGPVGVNIGANKDSPDMVGDYVAGVKAMSSVADYLTVNISSPNTPGLRALQNHGALDTLLSAIAGARSAMGPPVFLKVAPDLEAGDPERILRSAVDNRIDAIIISNTTVSRPALKSELAREQGGLSGQPLKPLALDTLRRFRSASGGQMPLIGCGGIATADDAWERICAGASLVQLYTAMIYEGPHVARHIATGLAQKLERSAFGSIAEAVGSG
ncbi:quinone-dependent dihydroorotate dehydrogenase [Sphingomonas sp. RG327]|uniref:Dihydroorotate dehydrogenase (quinone) n=1 Tax=Sphingomonas anseongensis TaxID=2908207 RepID=A0ABT0RHM6_9SPHN|nr:quinone-dependent dihydroorotate dehydrogenase [Sphingomonas anseongensis]MCL6679794.1 quinone-dependent dihydroorotate dehydrogenase [Sphingomonas anseongensis]